MKLNVKVISAANLPPVRFGLNSYCVLSLTGKKTFKTSFVTKSCFPNWDEVFQFDVTNLDKDFLDVVVMHQGIGEHEIGKFTIGLSNLPINKIIEKSYSLSETNGTVNLLIQLTDQDIKPFQEEPVTPPTPQPEETDKKSKASDNTKEASNGNSVHSFKVFSKPDAPQMGPMAVYRKPETK